MSNTPRPALALVAFAALVPAPVLVQNWIRQYPMTEPDLLDVATDGLGTVFAVGNDGVVLRSSDAALTWAQHHAATGRLAAVEFQGSVVLAGGDGLFRSVDGGVSFTSTHPVTGVQSIEAVGASNAWAVTPMPESGALARRRAASPRPTARVRCIRSAAWPRWRSSAPPASGSGPSVWG